MNRCNCNNPIKTTQSGRPVNFPRRTVQQPVSSGRDVNFSRRTVQQPVSSNQRMNFNPTIPRRVNFVSNNTGNQIPVLEEFREEAQQIENSFVTPVYTNTPNQSTLSRFMYPILELDEENLDLYSAASNVATSLNNVLNVEHAIEDLNQAENELQMYPAASNLLRDAAANIAHAIGDLTSLNM
jgi:hypothetical protein